MNENTSLLEIKGIGDKTFRLFKKLSLETVGDLLAHYPRDYEKLEEPVSISQLKNGETAAVSAGVLTINGIRKIRNLTIMNVLVRDSSGSMQLTFFNMPYLQKTLKPGMHYVFRGTVQIKGPSLLMEQPKIYTPDEYHRMTGVLQPRYSLTKGMTNQMVQKMVRSVLKEMPVQEEYLPADILQSAALISRQQAVKKIHFPGSTEDFRIAHRRLAFDEFFSFLITLRRNKDYTSILPNEYRMTETADTIQYLEKLPFQLTKGQKQVWQEIRDDFNSNACMNRLVQGDVGSGKTIVATLALLMTAANGYQGAMMAPTEVLATQHYEGIVKDTEKYGLLFKPVLLTGSMTAKEKKEAYQKIASGEANLIIGTHALIQDKVVYNNLALVVTDEQHRFGVKQRETLAQKGLHPHVLVMSATPIPRTLAIILYGDLKISAIRELPANRLPIKNCVVNTSFRNKAYKFIEDQVALGHQAYVICPQVEEGEMEDLENVTDYAEKLRSVLPPSINVAHLHGKMKPAEKNRIMEEYAAGNIQVLVSTTVIEVGINVPNSTVMMVENAERFGLAQLHQLRGRVGRGDAQSYCIFISSNDKKETMERLDILNRSNDGFYIASEDLKLRGPGDLFGIRQSGEFAFHIGSIYDDSELLKQAAELTDRLLSQDPDLSHKEHQALKKYLESATANQVDFRTI